MSKEVSEELRLRIEAVGNKRARFVLDRIARNGLVTTEEINHAGYEHPPRAVRDARELGFSIQTIKVKHSNGRSIAAYQFMEGKTVRGKKSGRLSLPKKRRDGIIGSAGSHCQVCIDTNNLQVDHRIPYEVAGESEAKQEDPYLVLCGSCNRKKSWSCEHCRNWLQDKDAEICRTCYWAEPSNYQHIAMEPHRRVDLVWIGDGEVKDYERIHNQSEESGKTVADYIKRKLRES